MDDEIDETIARIAAALRPMPPVEPARKASVLVAVAAERERARATRRRAARAWRVAGSLGVAAAAGLLLTVWWRDVAGGRDALRSTTRATAASVTTLAPSPTPTTRLTASESADVAPLPVQLVLRAPDAHRVSVVGDFNGWDAAANTLSRDAASGLWSGTVALRPGRHVYAFIVDDSVWVRDPRTPQARDADFGRPGSVLLVGRP